MATADRSREEASRRREERKFHLLERILDPPGQILFARYGPDFQCLLFSPFISPPCERVNLSFRKSFLYPHPLQTGRSNHNKPLAVYKLSYPIISRDRNNMKSDMVCHIEDAPILLPP